MSQTDALKLLIGMLNASAAVFAGAPVGGIPDGARLAAVAVAAACGFGLLFMDKIGKEPDDEPKRRRPVKSLAAEVTGLTPAQRRQLRIEVEALDAREGADR